MAESKRPLLSLRRKGAHLVLSGDSESVKKLQKAATILEFLQEILQKNADTIESPEFVTMLKILYSQFLNYSARLRTKQMAGE